MSLGADTKTGIWLTNSVAQVAAEPHIIEALRYDLGYPDEEAPGGWIPLVDLSGSMLTGLVPYAQRVLEKFGVPYEVFDRREPPLEQIPLWAAGMPKLRDYQDRLVNAALKAGRGVIDSPPRSGKTLMGGAIVDRNPLRTLWICPTRAIVNQTVAKLREWFGLGVDIHAHMGGGGMKAKMRSRVEANRALVVVSTAASAVKLPKVTYDKFDRLIIDEFHHAAAATYHEINRLADNVYERFGLTGTHFRSRSSDEIRMHAVLSEVIGSVPVSQLIADGHLAPADVWFVPVEVPRCYVGNTNDAYPIAVVNHVTRNAWVVWAARQLAALGKRTIVLIGWIDHGERLLEMMPEATLVHSKVPGDDVVMTAVNAFNRGEIPILIGTTVLGEGMDLPGADALVYAKAGRASVTVTQDFYRVLTAHPDKDRAVVVDFADRHSFPQLRQAEARAKLYARVPEFSVQLLSDPQTFVRRISGADTLDSNETGR